MATYIPMTSIQNTLMGLEKIGEWKVGEDLINGTLKGTQEWECEFIQITGRNSIIAFSLN